MFIDFTANRCSRAPAERNVTGREIGRRINFEAYKHSVPAGIGDLRKSFFIFHQPLLLPL